ncbi:MAG TPA: DUF1552 domain-containing protein [Gemmataceae bacterium]|nr:DUF1552 domain-containing protein [Gemmataceae bacterium]
MTHNGRLLSRRTMLRGAGAVLALPFLEAMVPARASAAATAKPPLRMGIFSVTGGSVIESWKPKEVGPLKRLPSILRPLEFAKTDILVLSGLSQEGRSEGLNAHEHCALTHLTGADEVKRVGGKLRAAISVDQAAARVVGEQTHLPSMEIGSPNHENQYSFAAADAPVPFEGNPRLVFERMFRGRKPTVPNWQRRAAARAAAVRDTARPDSPELSLLDLVREDADDLRRKLGGADRRRLDEYLASVRAIEKRVENGERRRREEILDAALPARSKLNIPKDLPPEGTPIWKITQPMNEDPEKHAGYIRLMADLMILAFQTDTTRVVTLAAGSDDCMFPGVVTVGYERHCHTLEHLGNAGRVEDADPIAREACRQIHAWYTRLFAEMIAKMRHVDEGGSSLLDNCMMLYTSYMADGGHGRDDYPILLAGHAGGTLTPGRHLAFPKHTPVANLYVEVLNRMGVPTVRFGNSHTAKHRAFGGRLPGLL